MIAATDQFVELQWRLLDTGGTSFQFPSGLWSTDEVIEYFTERQNRFNRDTKLLLAHLPLAFSAAQASAAAPVDWIATQNGTWIDTPTRTASTVTTGDRYAAEHGISQTNNPPLRPVILDDQSAGPLTIELYPPPVTEGVLDLLYATVLTAIAADSDATFDLPDDFVPFVTYGVLADMLSKDGRGQDLARAAYCEERYSSGVKIAAIMLEGYVI
jgi:hypothetical protein